MAEEQGRDSREIRQLLRRVQDYAERMRYAYIIPEMMLLALLHDKKCSTMVTALTTDAIAGNAVASIEKEVSEYIDGVVEKTDRIDEILATTAYTNLIQSSIAHGGMRAMDADSLCVFMMLFSDSSNASIHFLSKHGIYEDNVREYISRYRSECIERTSVFVKIRCRLDINGA